MRLIITKFKHKKTGEEVFSLGEEGFNNIKVLYKKVGESNTLEFIGLDTTKNLLKEYINEGSFIEYLTTPKE